MRHPFPVMLVGAAATLSGCGRPADAPMAPPAPAVSAASQASAPIAGDRWVGRWQGPEGTFLDVTDGPGTYRITVQNLDGPRQFDAKAGSGTLVFVRDGVIETVRACTGPDTGMKWLADRTDCLVVKHGEGYCRG